VQRTGRGEVNWIIETKGRVWEDTAAKDAAMRDWCARISQQTSQCWEYVRVNQSAFEFYKPNTLVEAIPMSSQENGSMTL
jgi:type III restriction enzyme